MKNTSKTKAKMFEFTGLHPIHATLGDGTEVTFQRGDVYELQMEDAYILGLIAQGYFVETTKTQKDHA